MKRNKNLQPIYFGGRLEKKPKEPKWMPYEKFLHTEDAFLLYIAQIWAKQNDAPTDHPKLANFNFRNLIPNYNEFLNSGGKF